MWSLLLACTEYGYESNAGLDGEEEDPPVQVEDTDAPVVDADGDGVVAEHDCDDANPSITIPPDVDDPDCDGVATTVSGGELVLFPPGGFDVWMGCTAAAICDADEKPPHPVEFSNWWRIGRTEVTQAQFIAVMDYDPAENKWCGDPCPVETITWSMAVDYTNALSRAAELDECYVCEGEEHDVQCVAVGNPYDCEGYRLPTEAEWEMAAKCNQDTTFAGSEDADAVAWYGDNSGDQTWPVASKAPNACGLYDMSGNVTEWVNDWYAPDYFSVSPVVDPMGPETGTEWAVRGGSASYTIGGLSTSNRTKKDGGSPKRGFRVARTVKF